MIVHGSKPKVMTEVMLVFLMVSLVPVVLVVSLLEPVESVLHMAVIMVNKLMHWIHRHSVFTAAPRTREWTTCQICNNYMRFLFSLNFCKLRSMFPLPQGFDTVGWAAGRASGL